MKNKVRTNIYWYILLHQKQGLPNPVTMLSVDLKVKTLDLGLFDINSTQVIKGQYIQWNLSWVTTAMRDHLSWKTTHFWQKDQHFNTSEPVTRDHLSWETTFLWPMGWFVKTGSTISRLGNSKNWLHHQWSYVHMRDLTNTKLCICYCNKTPGFTDP